MNINSGLVGGSFNLPPWFGSVNPGPARAHHRVLALGSYSLSCFDFEGFLSKLAGSNEASIVLVRDAMSD